MEADREKAAATISFSCPSVTGFLRFWAKIRYSQPG